MIFADRGPDASPDGEETGAQERSPEESADGRTARRWWRLSHPWRVAVPALGVAALAALAWLAAARLPGWARARVEASLEEHLAADVRLGAFTVGFQPWPPLVRVEGGAVELARIDGGGRRPFLTLETFSATLPPTGLLGSAIRLSEVSVEGLDFTVLRGRPDAGTGSPPSAFETPDLRIAELVSTDARLTVELEPPREPLVFEIAHVRLDGVSLEAAFAYEADLTNPIPPGRVHAAGTFGPWHAGAMRETPLDGDYELIDADLSVFPGIAGLVGSTGRFVGVLGRIDVDGTARVPDFALTSAGRPVPLEARFAATVDGSNGDTVLRQVEATLGESPLTVSGRIVGDEAGEGRHVDLEAGMAGARLEDVLRLAVEADPPPMSGELTVDARIHVPPGDADVVRRMTLEGDFRVARGRFAEGGIQARVDELSQRGRGEPGREPEDRVFTNLTGRFAMRDATMRFDELRMRVPGADVSLAGTYTVEAQALALAGDLRLEASLSRTQTGIRSFFLRALDPLFRRDGAGTLLPMRVEGRVDAPDFRVEIGRALNPFR